MGFLRLSFRLFFIGMGKRLRLSTNLKFEINIIGSLTTRDKFRYCLVPFYFAGLY